MKLGEYMEIVTAVDDEAAAVAFYEKLGFVLVGENVVSDGSYNLRVRKGDFPSPLLSYAGSSSPSEFIAPGNLPVSTSIVSGDIPMPGGSPLTRTPLSRLGKFGEFAVPVEDTQASVDFWRQYGYETLHFANAGYPFAILSDNLFVLGLHQTTEFNVPYITYFAPDMDRIIADLKAGGFAVTDFPPEVDGKVVNASMTGPGGIGIFLFQGEV